MRLQSFVNLKAVIYPCLIEDNNHDGKCIRLKEGLQTSVLRLPMIMDKHVVGYFRAGAVETDQKIVEDKIFN